MADRYDIAVIGSGPAGLSAAINAVVRNKKTVVFGVKEFSRKLLKAPKVNNYLGFYDISGEEMKSKFKEHAEKMGVDIKLNRITAVYAMGNYFALMSGNDTFEASSVIITTGMEFTKPIKGEEQYVGQGVGYCATCDAPLYRGKTVTVVGYGKEAEEEADFTSELTKKLYYVPMYNGDYKLNENIEVVKGKILEITKEDDGLSLHLEDRILKSDGIFILKDSVSSDQLVPGLLMEEGHIKVDRNMRTNIEGLFAAGDCVGKPYQIIKAAGEGQVAALNAASFLNGKGTE